MKITSTLLQLFTVVVFTGCSFRYEPEKQDHIFIHSSSSDESPAFQTAADRSLVFKVVADKANGNIILYTFQSGEANTGASIQLLCLTAKLVHDGVTLDPQKATPPAVGKGEERLRIEECSSKGLLTVNQSNGAMISFKTTGNLKNEFSIVLPIIEGSQTASLGTVKFKRQMHKSSFSIR